MPKRARIVSIAIACVCAVAACSGTPDGGDAGTASAGDGGGTGAAGCGTYSSGFPACDQCVHQSCCVESAACSAGVEAGESTCEQLFGCILTCAATPGADGAAPPSYGACENQCRPGFSTDDYRNEMALDSCIGLQCKNDCPIAHP
jgi:hypothetical protein